MPRNRFAKGSRKNKEENLYSEVDEAQVRPKTIPSPSLSTVETDYRNELSDAEYENVVRRSHTLGGYLDTRKLVRNLHRSQSARIQQEKAETDSSQESSRHTLPPRMRRLQTRQHTRITSPARRFTRLPSTPTTPTRPFTRQPLNSSTPTRPFLRHTPPASLPDRYCTSYRPPPTPPRRPSSMKQPTSAGHCKLHNQHYLESYIFKVNTEEPTTLKGDHSGRTYAKIPEGSLIRADSHYRGTPGQITHQATTCTQTEDPWLSSFQRSFQNLKL